MSRKIGVLDEKAVVKKLSLVSVLGNAALSAFKLFAGVAGASGAMVSDAVHSLSDVLTTFIALLGVKLSRKAPDREHPYGHERLECVASLALGLILAATGVGIGRTGVMRIVSGDYRSLAVPGAIALIAAVVSILSKEAMYRYTLHYAKLIGSAAFTADAWHHRSDALSSIGSLIGIGGAMLGVPVMDSIASVVICLFILKAAFDILRDAFRKMLDTSCGEAFDEQLSAFVAAQEDVVRVDSLRSRMFGDRVYIDLEIGVDGSKSLREAHGVAERVHERVEADFPSVKHIMVHVNPVD